MSEEYKVQVSVKDKAGNLLNVRGQTAAEVQAIFEEAAGKSYFHSFLLTPEEAKVLAPELVSADEAQALVTKHLGPDQVEPASAAQVKYLASLGVAEEEAQKLSKKAASEEINKRKGSK